MDPDDYDSLADALSGYQRAFELAPDSVTFAILRNQDTAFYIADAISILMAVSIVAGILWAATKAEPQKLGYALITAILTFAMITPMNADTLYLKSLDQHVAIDKQPFGQFTIYKGSYALLSYWNSFLTKMAEYRTGGSPSISIERVLTNHYANALLDAEGKETLVRLYVDYNAACTGLADTGIAMGEITSAQAGAIGLYGGSGLGMGYTMDSHLGAAGEENDDDWNGWDTGRNGTYRVSTTFKNIKRLALNMRFYTTHLDESEYQTGREKASRYLWDNPNWATNFNRPPAENYYTIYNRDWWIKQLAIRDDRDPSDWNLNPKTFSLQDQPFEHLLTNPEPLPNWASRSDYERHSSKVYLDTCRKFYLASEVAFVEYFDAIHDYSMKLSFIDSVPRIREITRTTGLIEHDSVTSHVSVTRATQKVFQFLNQSTLKEKENEGLRDTFKKGQSIIEAGFHGIVGWWTGYQNKFGILGAIAMNVSLISVLYLTTPIFLIFANFKGIEVLILWFNLFLASVLMLAVNSFIITLGMMDIYQNFVDSSIRSYRVSGTANILLLQDLSWSNSYLVILATMIGSDAAIAYMFVFKDGSGLKRLNTHSAGLARGTGSLMIGAAYMAMSAISGPAGKALGATGKVASQAPNATINGPPGGTQIIHMGNPQKGNSPSRSKSPPRGNPPPRSNSPV